jgi:hypothetical protein
MRLPPTFTPVEPSADALRTAASHTIRPGGRNVRFFDCDNSNQRDAGWQFAAIDYALE